MASVATLGVTRDVVDCGDFTVAHVEHPPGAFYDAHSHDRTYISLALSGMFEERIGVTSERTESGGVIVMPAGTSHRERIGPAGYRAMIVTVRAGAHDVDHSEWRISDAGEAARPLLRLYQAFRRFGAAEADAMREELVALREALAPPTNEGVSRSCASAARAMINPLMRVADIARELGVTPAYLSRAFRRAFGETMSEALRRARTRVAASRLASTDDAISDIALASGFADQSHLCRVFRHELGMTPAAYRTLMRSNPF